MLKNLFANKGKKRLTGVYKIIDNKLVEYETLPYGGSVNSIINDLGFSLDQIHTILTFHSKYITEIGVKILTKIPVFVITNSNVNDFSMFKLNEELNNVDWDFEYSALEVESILEQGIDVLTLDYLKSVTELTMIDESKYLANNWDLYFHFKNNVLIGFTSTDGLDASSKWLKNLNYNMFNNMLKEAQSYHKSKIDAIEEVNIQCSAILSIPQGLNNEHISNFMNSFGNCNFFNLYITLYGGKTDVKKGDFLLVNKGRMIELSDDKFIVSSFSYLFNENGLLINILKE